MKAFSFLLYLNHPANVPNSSKISVGRYNSQLSEQSSYDGDLFINQQQHHQSTNNRHSSAVVYSTVPRANSRLDENNNKKPPPPPPMPASQPITPMSTLRSQKSVDNYARQQSTACKAIKTFYFKDFYLIF